MTHAVMGSPWAQLEAWLVLPALMLLTGAGVGLLAERAFRVQLPGPLVAPLGLCASIVLVYPVYRVGLAAPVAAVVLGVAAVAGLVLHRGRLRAEGGRVAGGWTSLTALAVFALYLAPVALTGDWTWAGYNLVNDTAYQFVLIDWIAGNGIPYEPQAVSTTSESVRVYLLTAYPLGSHAHLATLSAIAQAPHEVLYQSYLSGLVASAGLALHALARRAGLAPPFAFLAAFVAAGAALTYAYAQQGNIKEMAFLAALTAAVGLGAEGLGREKPLGHALCVAVALVAAVFVFYAAAAPYVGVVALLLAAAALWLAPGAVARRRLLAAGAVAALVIAVASVPVLGSLRTSQQALQGTFSAANVEELGHLVRPLPLIQGAGIWLTGDYRVPIPDERADLIAGVGILLVVVLGAAGLVVLLRRRELGSALLLGTGILVYALVSGRTSPYGDGKMLALLSPGVVLAAMLGAFLLRGRLRLPGLVAGAVVAVLVLWSVALSYHAVRLAPDERMESLQALGDRYAGSERLMLFNEFEEFAKVFMADARINTPTESYTQSHIRLLEGGDFPARSFDLDQIEPTWLQTYPYIILRRKPTASRPPANYVLEHRNAHYEVWRRTASPTVTSTLPLNDLNDADAEMPCDDLLRWVDGTGQGSDLVAARRPETVAWDVATARRRPPGWNPDPERPGQVLLATPGVARGSVTVRGGRYQAWVEGAHGRPLEVRIDGRRVGAAVGMNPPGGWLRAGDEIELPAGRHTVEVERPGGGFAPGDGARSTLGAVALVARGDTELVHVVRDDTRAKLCGREWDWIQSVPARAAT